MNDFKLEILEMLKNYRTLVGQLAMQTEFPPLAYDPAIAKLDTLIAKVERSYVNE